MPNEQNALAQPFGEGNQPRHITGAAPSRLFRWVYQVPVTTPNAAPRLAEVCVPAVDVQGTLASFQEMGISPPLTRQLQRELTTLNRLQITTNINLRALLGKIELVEDDLERRHRSFSTRYRERGEALRAERAEKEQAQHEYATLHAAHADLQATVDHIRQDVQAKEHHIEALIREDLARAEENQQLRESLRFTREALSHSGHTHHGKVTWTTDRIYLDVEYPLHRSATSGLHWPKMTVNFRIGEPPNSPGLTVQVLHRSRSQAQQSFGLGFYTNGHKRAMITTTAMDIPKIGRGGLQWTLPMVDSRCESPRESWQLYGVYTTPNEKTDGFGGQLHVSKRLFPSRSDSRRDSRSDKRSASHSEQPARVRWPYVGGHHASFARVQPLAPQHFAIASLHESRRKAISDHLGLPMFVAILCVWACLTRVFRKNTWTLDPPV